MNKEEVEERACYHVRLDRASLRHSLKQISRKSRLLGEAGLF